MMIFLTVGTCRAPGADDTEPADVADSLTLPANESDAGADSVVLEPILYTPESDTTLIAAYYERGGDSSRDISPTLTMLKSVAVPGWGQLSNGRYIKAGLIAVVESYFIYRAVDYGRLASDWRDRWQSEPDTSSLRGIYFSRYADYRDTRNSFIWYTAITVFFSMIDAYVDAHLSNFPEDIPTSERLSVDVEPGRELRLAVSYRF